MLNSSNKTLILNIERDDFMKKKVLSIILSAVLCAGVFAGCTSNGGTSTGTTSGGTDSSGTASGTTSGGTASKTVDELLTEKYAEPVTVNIVLGYRDSENPDTPDSITPETSTAVKRFKEDLNIDLKYSWIVNNDQYEAKFGAELAAGNLPDIMLLSPTQFEDIYSQGGLGDLTDAFNNYTNEAIKQVTNYDGQLINATSRDGKVYGLPVATYPGQVTSQIYYDLNKLKEAGIENYDMLPKTIAEFEALCDKIMALDIDKDGKTGEPVIPGNKWYIDAGLADFSPVFHAYESWAGGSGANGWYDDGSGTLKYAGIQPELTKSLTKLNEWYKKGYMAKDFAAQDVWGADAPVVSDIVKGEYAIVMGSWWIPNWPLNDNKKNNPDAEWVVGPTLTVDGGTAKIMVPRYPINNVVAISRDFKNPEALFKMINWSISYSEKTNYPDFKEKATEAELLEYNSYVYTWLPYRVFCPSSLVDNFNFVAEKDKAGITSIKPEEGLNNTEFWGAWSSYVKTKNGDADASVWGLYLSRLDPQGGVGKMYELYTNAEKQYDEVYITTPSMITKKSEMDKYRDSTFLSMIMGETPISSFDKYVSEWKNLGGNDIEKEVNEWYKNK